MSPMSETAVVTRVFERFGCIYVEGKAKTDRGWEADAFTVPKSEIIQMDRKEFQAFALKQLPFVPVNREWEHTKM